MTALSVRVSEDPARPLGHAIITLSGLPRGLETFEFTLSRHGFAANHLGSDGWQGAECWLQPEEAWYSGDAIKFVVHPDLAFQLENMPYTLGVRGQGLADVVAVTFVWPLELELEEGTVGGERRVVGGTRVNATPKPRPEPEPSAMPAVESLEVSKADLPIPDVAIPEISAEPMADADDAPTQIVGHRVRAPHSTQDAPTRVVEGRIRPPVSEPGRPSSEEPTHKISEQQVPPAGGDGPPTVPSPLPPPLPAKDLPTVVAPSGRPAPLSESPPIPAETAGEGRPGGGFRLSTGLILLAALAVLAALGGWWWFGPHAADKLPMATPPTGAPTSIHRAPEPKPAPEPIPAPAPVPAPVPVPAPIPVPAPVPVPAPEPPAPERTPVPPPISTPPPVLAPVTSGQPPAPERTPAPPPVAPVPQVPLKPPPAPPTRPGGSGRSLEDELKSQFDPTLRELEKGLRRPKSSP
ncbi:MAG: hypothetical protein U1F70_14835 [Candidatus Competibacteraceae bacterium]